MATEVGEAVVKLSFDDNDAKKGMNSAKNHVKEFADSAAKTIKGIGVAVTAAFTAATAAAVKFSKDSLAAFNAQEEAVLKLESAAKQHNWVEGATDELMKYNAQLQKTGVIGDEVNAVAQSQFAAMGLSLGAIKDLTPALDNLLVKNKGVNASMEDAASMATALGKAIETGNTKKLIAYGITLDKTTSKLFENGTAAERAFILNQQVADSVGDLNEQMAGTLQGRIKQLSNSFGDLQESFGAFLQGKKDIDEFFEEFDTFIDDVVTIISEMAPQIIDGILKLVQKINEKLPELVEKLLPLITEIVIGLATALIENAPLLIDSVVKIAVAVGKAVIENLPKIMESIGKVLPKAIGPLLGIIGGAFVLGKIRNLLGGMFSGGGLLNTITTGAKTFITTVGNLLTTGINFLGDLLSSIVGVITKPMQTLFEGVAKAIAGFIKAFAGPEVLAGAAGFAAAAASIAAAIVLIGGAIGIVMPALEGLMNNIVIPLATFIADTVLALITTLTDAIINITQQAFIPLGEFLRDTLIAILETFTSVVERLTNNAIVPLINTLSGAFIGILKTVGDILNGVVKSALEGIADIVEATGVAFEGMGHGIEMALNGVNAVLSTFADLIKSIADAVVAVVALVQGRSINYGHGYAHLFAEGGRVEGPGTSTSDSIPARLSDGEFVIKASSAKMIGYDTLDDMNENGRLPASAIIYNWAAVLANSVTGQMQGRNGGEMNVFMTNEINNRLDAQDVGRVMMESIRRSA